MKKTILQSVVVVVLVSMVIFLVMKFTDFSIDFMFQKGTRPEISGWIAYWKEKDAYKLLDRHAKVFHTISPYWYDIDKNFTLRDVSPETDKSKIISELSAKGVSVLPLVNTPLSFDKLSPLFEQAHADEVIQQITSRMLLLGVKGVDIDIEEMNAKDQPAYLDFLRKLHARLAEKNLFMSASVLAQTGTRDQDGNFHHSVDYSEVGKIADNVNILVYDLHGPGSEAGPITTIDWLKEVITFSLAKIPKEKIVIGLPMYGYNWQLQSTAPEPYPYDEFIERFDSDKKFTKQRDEASAQLRYVGPGQEAWVSDAHAVKVYIQTAQQFGLNRFIIWQIGGMDEDMF